MIPFQINSNSRDDMHEYLVKCFRFQDYCDSLKERFPTIDFTGFRWLSTHNASSRIALLKLMLIDIKEFLSTNANIPSVISIGAEIFNAYDDKIDDRFFWDTIIALYLQLIYDKSKPTTMRNFYKSNLEKYGIKYDSYTDYFKDYIDDQPIGEYLNIQKRNLEALHSRRYIMNCFHIQQYILIHSYSKSPFSERESDDNATQNPFKMRKLLPLLEAADYYNNPSIYHFDEAVQRICDKIYNKMSEKEKEHFGSYRDPREQQMEQQLTDYLVEQTYSYEIYAQIASADRIINSLKQLCSRDRDLFRRVSEEIESVKDIPLFEGLGPAEKVV